MNHNVKREYVSKEVKSQHIERDSEKIAHYRELSARLFDLKDDLYKDPHFSEAALQQTTNILSINPELYTAWNVRRRLLQCIDGESDLYVNLLNADLKLLLGLLQRYPKCYWIWHHRKWCLFLLVGLQKADWQYEFKTILKLLELDSRNFHGWEYRRFVVYNMEKEMESSLSQLELKISEFEYTTCKINQNISNFSAWHNRSRLILDIHLSGPHLGVLRCLKSPYDTLVHELELIKTGMYMDSDDSSIWLYLQWLLTCDLFVNDLALNPQNTSLLLILEQQLRIVTELNQLEKSESPSNSDNAWCLKTMVLIKRLISLQDTTKEAKMKIDIDQHLHSLMVIDPLRRGKYLDQIEAACSIL